MKTYKNGVLAGLITGLLVAIIWLVIIAAFYNKKMSQHDQAHTGEIIIAPTVENPQMVEVNPTTKDYYYVIFKPENTVFICRYTGKGEKMLVQASHPDGTPITADELGINVE